jgi:hypothetical protein
LRNAKNSLAENTDLKKIFAKVLTNNKKSARVKLRESICSYYIRNKGVKKRYSFIVVEGMQYLANSTPLNSLKMSKNLWETIFICSFFCVIWGRLHVKRFGRRGSK